MLTILSYKECLHINIDIEDEVNFIKFSLWIHFACHKFLSESLFHFGLLIFNLLSLLVFHEALYIEWKLYKKWQVGDMNTQYRNYGIPGHRDNWMETCCQLVGFGESLKGHVQPLDKRRNHNLGPQGCQILKNFKNAK